MPPKGVPTIKCNYCSKKIYSQGGLLSHLKQNKGCAQQHSSSSAFHGGADDVHRTADQYLSYTTLASYSNKQQKQNRSIPRQGFFSARDEEDGSDNDNPFNMMEEEEDDDEDGGGGSSILQNEDPPSSTTMTILNDFKSYVNYAINSYEDFTNAENNAIELLYTLRQTKVSLGTYQEIMKWHLSIMRRTPGVKGNFGNNTIINRNKLYTELFRRYNMFDNCLNIIQEIKLPFSLATARIVTNSTSWCIQSLLTDPRLTDNDFLFHNNNPLAPPPTTIDTISDINISKAYAKWYKHYIKKPGEEVLLPILFYIDGAATGQFADLPITQLRITLGIFNRKAREKGHSWRTLGYVPAYSVEEATGNRTLHQSGHVESGLRHEAQGDGNSTNIAVCTEHKAQDLHSILAKILESFIEIQNTGFVWDLMYRGKKYSSIKFIPYIHFIKADTEEADQLAGKYTSGTQGVKQLCRYCFYPTRKSNYPRAEYDRKTVTAINNLIQNKDAVGLQEMSQQIIENACYKLRFGAHNDEGVHGSCPVEMLHCLHLGIFKYVCDFFFEQLGKSLSLWNKSMAWQLHMETFSKTKSAQHAQNKVF
jgi:hypothetical protein